MIDSEKIIHEYGKVMELTAGHTASPIRFLPFPKEQIKLALFAALRTETNEKNLAALRNGYIYLATFLSDEDAMVVRRFENFSRDMADNQQPKYPEDASLQARYIQIQNNIAKEMEKLSKEIGTS